MIEIDTDSDPDACSQCTYYIAVYGSQEATYTIMASLTTSYFQLQDGIPMTGSVSWSSWNYYQFYDSHGSARDFRVVLSSVSGNVDLFITLGT